MAGTRAALAPRGDRGPARWLRGGEGARPARSGLGTRFAGARPAAGPEARRRSPFPGSPRVVWGRRDALPVESWGPGGSGPALRSRRVPCALRAVTPGRPGPPGIRVGNPGSAFSTFERWWNVPGFSSVRPLLVRFLVFSDCFALPSKFRFHFPPIHFLSLGD